jgi:hypothetical protein
MSRSSLPIDVPPRTRLLGRALLTAFVAALLAAAGLVAASPAAAKTAPANIWVSAVTCSTGDDGTAVMEYEGLVEHDYTWTVTGEAYSVGGILGGHGEFLLEGLAPGLYSINVSVFDQAPEVWGTFTVDACPPDVDVAVTPLLCSTGDNGEALLTLTGLVPGEAYTYSVTGPNFEVGGLLDEVAETEDIELIGMPPGNYLAYAEQVVQQPEAAAAAVPDLPNFDWVGFAIEPCQPGIVVEVTECAASGGTGAADVTLSNLVAGVEYSVRVTDQGVADGTPYGDVLTVTGAADGTATVEASGLPAGHEYTAWVDGVWVAEPWEEPPFLGGGNFTPLETVVLAASADFTLAPCPAAPATVPTQPAALAATGTDGVGGLLTGSMLLLGLGGAALIAARRRGTAARELS